MTPRLSIIIPTVGRPTLARTLESILTSGYTLADDDVWVIGDGEQPAAREVVTAFKDLLRISYFEIPAQKKLGHPQRTIAQILATGTHLVHIDDDDVFAPDALFMIKRAIAESPDRPLIFKMKCVSGRHHWEKLWGIPSLFLGNIGTPMFVAPNIKNRLAPWEPKPGGDFEHISNTVNKFGGPAFIVWRQEVIVYVN